MVELFQEVVTEVDSPAHSHLDREDPILLPDTSNNVNSNAISDDEKNVESPIEVESPLESPADIENHEDVPESPDVDASDLDLEDQMLLPGHISYGQRIRRWWKLSTLRRFLRNFTAVVETIKKLNVLCENQTHQTCS